MQTNSDCPYIVGEVLNELTQFTKEGNREQGTDKKHPFAPV